ncbi:SPX domain-containing protein [Polychaeton citri CBS 116435]|uniref:SPX domain-containing protein n=1 Tax=Polychaeton citri CBS 116435 TaxID=1314669 RepID=A0A9P4UM41_9PEZI|nr:SPX domain-containing protein [Polychaeton citri CBS 116435]
MKFGKHIQKRQLDIPEYAASFVDYKALKKLIKKLSATPILHAQEAYQDGALSDPQASLQANKATFFFRLERELEKVNTFYLQKEAELNLRLRTLLDKKQGLQFRSTSTSKLSSSYVLLDEGFRLFSNDLDKLQQFVEINQTAFSKILKKWDKTSKSRTKELYLSRAVEVQPCFNRDIISDLSDQATTGLLELQAWAEGEKIAYTPAVDLEQRPQTGTPDDEPDAQILQAVNAGNVTLVGEWISRLPMTQEGSDRLSRIFLTTIRTATFTAQQVLCSDLRLNYNFADAINERNSLHEAASIGNIEVLRTALARAANVREPDVYGRLPLHYASMHGHVHILTLLAEAASDTVDRKDIDGFTPLIHGIVHSRPGCVQAMLELGAHVNPDSSTGHIPLNLACQYGSLDIVEFLLRQNPRILPDAEGLFPQHLVARFGRNQQILASLGAYGVDMDQPDKLYQWTPIFHAASEGHIPCLQALLSLGVNPDIDDEKGLSAVYYAAWEGHLDCMQLLVEASVSARALAHGQMEVQVGLPPPSSLQPPAQQDAETIPDLTLPPPMVPLRRYGHNFLETTRTFILLSFDKLGCESIEFYGDNKYPAARLTISSKSSDLVPRNVPLPIQDDFKAISFQIENLETFSIDFDIFPTFGSKVIARAAASSRVFTSEKNSTGLWHLELFDPRLRAIGRISFRFQVITPFQGIPLEITHFATYWKATSQDDSHPSNLITGSSLSGDFIRLFVQVTSDGVPVLFPEWSLPHRRHELVSRLTFEEFLLSLSDGETAIAQDTRKNRLSDLVGEGLASRNLDGVQTHLNGSYAALSDVLTILPPEVNVELHVCYPDRAEEDMLQLGPTQNINTVADAILRVVFEHARLLRETTAANGGNFGLRSFVMSSYNADMCMTLNWKQPNYPVLLCNDLGSSDFNPSNNPHLSLAKTNCGRTSSSVKEAVRVAQSNNFMGLICTSRLLDLVPALISSIKEAGLVLIEDQTFSPPSNEVTSLLDLPIGVDGLLSGNAVLRFKEAIDQ